MADIQELGNDGQQNSDIGNASEETDGSLITPSSETNSSTKRAFFSIASTENYKSDTNPNGWTPVANEICTDKDGLYYIWGKDEKGNMIRLSPLADFLNEWNELKRLGIINNAEAFRLNGKIYNFIFDNTKMVLRLNTEINIYDEYKYYRVRKIERDAKTGDYIYITGIRNEESGEVLTNFGNIVSKNGKKIPSSVAMINPCEDGKNYIVEFFDDNRTLIGSQVFFAKAGVTMDFSLSPDMAITDLIINTDRPHDEENSCFLYQNEDPNNLIIRVGLKYADGNLRDITEEGYTTGRLKFEGRDEIDSSKLTADPEEAQRITVIYFVDKDNAKNPSTMGTTTEEALLDPNTISLSKSLKVYIIEDIYDAIIDVVIHGYQETTGSKDNITKIYKIKVFAKYESGNIRDLTPVMDKSRFLSANGFEYNKDTGCLETSIVLSNFAIQTLIPQGRSVALFSKSFSCEFTEYDKKLRINNTEGGFDGKDKDVHKVTNFNSTQGKMKLIEGATLTQLLETYSYKYNLEVGQYKVPTHVLVRSALNPSIIYSGDSIIDSYAALDSTNGIINYRIPDNRLILEEDPLLIEFYKIETDPDTGARTSIFLTNVQRTYAQFTTNALS